MPAVVVEEVDVWVADEVVESGTTMPRSTGSSAHPLMASANASSPMRSEIDDICVTVLVVLDLAANRAVGLECELSQPHEIEPRLEAIEVAEVGRGQRVDPHEATFGSADRQFVDAQHRGERRRVGEGAHACTASQRRRDRVGDAVDHQIGGQPKDHLGTYAHVPHDDEGV